MFKQLSSSSKLSLASNFAGLRLQISYVSPDQLQPGSNQVRKHGSRQLKQIARRIAEHGFLMPVIAYGDVIAAGAARVEAARLLGLGEVPVIRTEHLTEEQMRLFAIADNKLAEGAEWNIDALRAEFESHCGKPA